MCRNPRAATLARGHVSFKLHHATSGYLQLLRQCFTKGRTLPEEQNLLVFYFIIFLHQNILIAFFYFAKCRPGHCPNSPSKMCGFVLFYHIIYVKNIYLHDR